MNMIKEEKGSVRFNDWNEKEIEVLNKHLLNTSKPMVYLLNMSEEDYIKKKNKWLGLTLVVHGSINIGRDAHSKFGIHYVVR